MKFRIALLAVCCAAALAQTGAPDTEKPPADVEQAVLARATEYYTLLLNHEYRKAEAMVAEDTKDFYYNGSKPNITKFEVKGVRFSDHFTRAVVSTVVSQKAVMPLGMPGGNAGDWALTLPSAWKFENGNWYYFVDQSVILNPVGKATRVQGASGSAGSTGVKVPTPEEIEKEISKPPDFAYGKVTADKPAVTLGPGETEKVAIVNGAQGQVRLRLSGQITGVAARLDRAQVDAGDKAILSLEAGKDATGGILYVQVIPTGESIPIIVKMK